MNIFAVSRNPIESAQQMIDKHIVKMPTETCQMLHTNALYFQYVQAYDKEPTLAELKAFHKETDSQMIKPAMLNHPSTIWARQSQDNFNWLYMHGYELCKEFTFRYGKEHGSYQRILNTEIPEDYETSWAFPVKGLTPISIAMDDKYRIKNVYDNEWDFVTESYRHYYIKGKWRFAEWRKRGRPEWFSLQIQMEQWRINNV